MLDPTMNPFNSAAYYQEYLVFIVQISDPIFYQGQSY